MRRQRRFAILAALALALAAEVPASCGLDQCPADPPRQRHLLFSVGGRQVAYDLGGQSGDYRVALLRAEAGTGAWLSGLWLGLVDLDSPAGTRRGTTNPTLFLQRQLGPAGATWAMQLGVQLELPVGSDEPAIRSDHTELLPYARLSTQSGRWTYAATLGWRESIGGEDDEELVTKVSKHSGHEHGELLVVSPHSSREMAGRIALGARLNERGVMAQASLEALRVLAEGESKDNFQVAGLALDWPLGAAWLLTPSVEVPFGAERRFDSAFGMRVQRRF
jgi:hypothetical protein